MAQIPQNISAYLGFAYPNIGYVIDGLKDATVRVGLERGFEEGQHIELRTPEGNVFGYAEIVDVYEPRLGAAWFDMTAVDDRNHPADSTTDLLDRLRSHYPGQKIDLDTRVTVIYFDCLKIQRVPPISPE